ncbi:MAG: hypothetical protein QW767_04340 [Thermoprotei archaeon]
MKLYELAEEVVRLIQAERDSPGLIQLNPNFYSETVDELSSVDKSSAFAEEFVDHVVENLFTLFCVRMNKLFEGAADSNATKDEKLLLTKYRELEGGFRSFAQSLRRDRNIVRPRRLLVSFNSPVDAFVDSTMTLLGPFKKRDMAYIPEEDALIMSRYSLIEVLSKVDQS